MNVSSIEHVPLKIFYAHYFSRESLSTTRVSPFQDLGPWSRHSESAEAGHHHDADDVYGIKRAKGKNICMGRI